jgi:hypothetical protein
MSTAATKRQSRAAKRRVQFDPSQPQLTTTEVTVTPSVTAHEWNALDPITWNCVCGAYFYAKPQLNRHHKTCAFYKQSNT